MSNAVTVPADKLAELQRDAARYRWLRSIGHEQLNAAMHYGLEALDKFVDDARGVKEGGNGHD